MRNFRTFLILAVGLSLGLTQTGFSAVRRISQDLKLPTQVVIEHQLIENPAAAGTTQILNANAGPTSAAATTVTTFAAQPDVPRNIVVTPGGTTADVAPCTVSVAGTDFFGQSISETFSFDAGASSGKTGSKAFKTVTSVFWPATCETGGFAATWSIGYGEKLGLKRCLNQAGDVVFSVAAGAYESTRPTVAALNTTISLNTADFNGSMNGSNDFDIYFFQSFRCLP